ncbi:hypothetical protein CYMTET_52450 [Cymbomonas tetramitiformis]|uniref:LTD domain-containing protein n=1 Tax=Cymbomonas tetramitiformis TaxID=36881 RepID=A0AAE0BIZ9_9CHLO|nr:hypothetical protein CYMTET_52450 [Cymbomonas tetramitiformis]
MRLLLCMLSLSVIKLQGKILINEYLPDPGSSNTEEWVELYNSDGSSSVDLAGYSISDDRGIGSAITIESATILPHGFYVCVVSSSDRYLNNGGDEVHVFDALGAEVDNASYSSASEDLSYFRFQDGGSWETEMKSPSRNSTNNATLSPLIINEYVASTDGSVDEWVELYNPHTTARVFLSGYSVNGSAGVFTLPLAETALEIPSNGLYLVPLSSARNAVAGDTVSLYFNGNLLDTALYEGAPGEGSKFRFPDGGDWIRDWETPSAGRSNNETLAGNRTSSLLVGAFNVQTYGVTKSSRSAVMDVLVEIFARYQLVGMQEIRETPDNSCGENTGSSVCKLLGLLNDHVVNTTRYNLTIGSQTPQDSTYSEQYMYVYDTSVLELLDARSYPDDGNHFTRDPYAARFRVIGPPESRLAQRGFDFAVAVLHTPPDEATEEISELDGLARWMEDSMDTDVMIMGDLNADGSYFDEDDG